MVTGRNRHTSIISWLSIIKAICSLRDLDHTDYRWLQNSAVHQLCITEIRVTTFDIGRMLQALNP